MAMSSLTIANEIARIRINQPIFTIDSGSEADFSVTDFADFADFADVDEAPARVDSLNFQQRRSRRKINETQFDKIKSICIKQYKANRVNSGSLGSTDAIVSTSDLNDLLATNVFKKNDIGNDLSILKTIHNVCAWHLQTPNKFGHTAALFVNDPGQGLLHAFVRHWDQCGEFMKISSEIAKIDSLKEHLINIKNANASDKKNYYKTFNNFKDYLDNLTGNDFINVHLALFNAQKELFKFINRNVSEHVGVEVSVEVKTKVARIRAWFEVKNSSNKIRYMVLCLSKENFEIVDAFEVDGVPNRTVRTITTLWFKEELPANLTQIW